MKNELKNRILESLFHEIDELEREKLEAWLDEDPSHHKLYEKLKKIHQQTPIDVSLALIDTQEALLKSKNKIVEAKDYSILTKRRHRHSRKLIALSLSSAASILIVFFLLYNTKPIPSVPDKQQSQSAVITLATGETIALENDSKVNKKVEAGEINVSQNKIIIKGEKLTKAGARNNAKNTLSVPHGKNYCITLSDGSKVWINALSELKFPTEFGDTRVVELSGEAFFDVAKDPNRPFIVKMKDYDVVVKGTSFNISNYNSDHLSKTTLCTGEVEVRLTEGSHQKFVLTPGNQLSINHQNKSVKIEEVNTKIYTAWREGYYYFENQSLETIFNYLSKWYKIESVDFESEELRSKLYNGKLQKEDDFAKALKIIEEGSNCMIVRDGGKLLIVKKQK